MSDSGNSVLALDQGTTGTTALVIRSDGTIVGRAYSEFRQHYPRPGWVEHDPKEIWQTSLEVAQRAMEQAGELPRALGITNQRETVVAWRRSTGEPLHRAIVWQDRRTADRCRNLRAEHGDEFLETRAGLTWDPYFSATKIEWLLRNSAAVAEARNENDLCFGTIDAWLIWNLTAGAVHATDHTNASRTMLYNVRTKEWDAELMSLFGVEREWLPDVCLSAEVIGETASGLFSGQMSIAGVAGDQQAALWGQGCWEPGQAKCTYGTGAFLLFPLGEGVLPRPGSGLLTTIGCDRSGQPINCVEGSVFIAGAAVQWLRDELGLIESAAETEELARSLESNDGVYMVPAFVGLGAPHWESEARGTIVGLTRGTGKAHIVRATLEAMAYSTRELVETVESSVAGYELGVLRVDGGVAANDWLMQFQSDLIGKTVSRPDQVESTALGAGGLAGIATDVWREARDFFEVRHFVDFTPATNLDNEYRGWKRAVSAAVAWASDRS